LKLVLILSQEEMYNSQKIFLVSIKYWRTKFCVVYWSSLQVFLQISFIK